MDLAEPHAVDPERLRSPCELEDVAEGRGLAGALSNLFDEQSEVHGRLLQRHCSRLLEPFRSGRARRSAQALAAKLLHNTQYLTQPHATTCFTKPPSPSTPAVAAPPTSQTPCQRSSPKAASA